MTRNHGGSPNSGTDLSTVLALERELQTARCRSDPNRLADLLADDFIEVGASGAVWDKASILELLDSEDTAEIEVLELGGRAIATIWYWCTGFRGSWAHERAEPRCGGASNRDGNWCTIRALR